MQWQSPCTRHTAARCICGSGLRAHSERVRQQLARANQPPSRLEFCTKWTACSCSSGGGSASPVSPGTCWKLERGHRRAEEERIAVQDGDAKSGGAACGGAKGTGQRQHHDQHHDQRDDHATGNNATGNNPTHYCQRRTAETAAWARGKGRRPGFLAL